MNKNFQSISQWKETANRLLANYKKRTNTNAYLELLKTLEWTYTEDARNLCRSENIPVDQLQRIADRIRAFIFV